VNLYCSYLEIYNEKMYDLLAVEEGRKTRSVTLDIREDRNHRIYVPNLTTIKLDTIGDIYEVIQEGTLNRAVGVTDMNERSSRSHTIFQLYLEDHSVDKSGTGTITKVSKLNLVDLAGSEKWNIFSESKMSGNRINELTSINKSLSTLGKCMFQLRNGNSHIAYRESKLTRLLQDSLGGNTKTAFVATITSSEVAFEETLSTLKFAARAMKVIVTAQINEMVDESVLLQRFEQEVEMLRHETARKDKRIRDLEKKNALLIKKLQSGGLGISKAPRNGKNIRASDSFLAVLEIAGAKDDSADQVRFFTRKLKQLRERELEVERYQRWMLTLPQTNRAGGKSLTTERKLDLMEKSILAQVRDLEVQKRNFLEESELHRKVLRDKDANDRNMLGVIQVLRQRVHQLEMSSPELRRKQILRKLEVVRHTKFTEAHETDNDENVIIFRDIKNKIIKGLARSIATFRSDLTSILQDHVKHVLGKAGKKKFGDLVEDMEVLVAGCSEALEESLLKRQGEFNGVLFGLVRSRKTTQIRSNSSVAVAVQTSRVLEEQNLHQVIRNSIAATSMAQLERSKDTREYFETTVSERMLLREAQGHIYVRLSSLRRSIERILKLLKSYESLFVNNTQIRYERECLEGKLRVIVQFVSQIEEESFISSQHGMSGKSITGGLKMPERRRKRRRKKKRQEEDSGETSKSKTGVQAATKPSERLSEVPKVSNMPVMLEFDAKQVALQKGKFVGVKKSLPLSEKARIMQKYRSSMKSLNYEGMF